MSVGMSAAWRAMQPKKKRCERCGLYYNETLAKCSHCGDLDERGLKALLESKKEETQGDAALGKYFFALAVLVAVLLLLTAF